MKTPINTVALLPNFLAIGLLKTTKIKTLKLGMVVKLSIWLSGIDGNRSAMIGMVPATALALVKRIEIDKSADANRHLAPRVIILPPYIQRLVFKDCLNIVPIGKCD